MIRFDNYTIGLNLKLLVLYIVEPGTKDLMEVLYIVDNNLKLAKDIGKDESDIILVQGVMECGLNIWGGIFFMNCEI